MANPNPWLNTTITPQTKGGGGVLSYSHVKGGYRSTHRVGRVDRWEEGDMVGGKYMIKSGPR